MTMIQIMATEKPRKHRASLPNRFSPSDAKTTVARAEANPSEQITMGAMIESASQKSAIEHQAGPTAERGEGHQVSFPNLIGQPR